MDHSTEAFYQDLPSFSEFSEIGDLKKYTPVPSDWYVLVADIVRSREAIAAGRYKDVNLIGAAVISSVLNRLGRDRIPFVFGGDGASLLVPSSDLRIASEALAGVARLADVQTGFDLRIAAFPMFELRRRGSDIRLRKYKLSEGNYLAMSVGGGMDLAERMLKTPQVYEGFRIRIEDPPLPDLTGLSCRWEKLKAEQGKIVSLIVSPRDVNEKAEAITGIRQDLAKVLARDPFGDGPNYNFVTRGNLRFRFPPSGLGMEIRLVGASKGRLKTAAKAVFECLAFLFGVKTRRQVGPLKPESYLSEIAANTDHRKLDDSLRLVLDLSDQQLDRLSEYLETASAEGRFAYGVHIADSALMTCFVSDLGASQHLHFIDGEGGGLSAAATDLARRFAHLRRPDPEVFEALKSAAT